MRKLAMVMAAVLCVGTAGIVWADNAAGDGSNSVNPQPLPPGGKSQVTTNNTGNGADDLNPQPYPPKGKLSSGDQAQISGNLNGDSKAGVNSNSKLATGDHIKKATLTTRKAGKGFYKEQGNLKKYKEGKPSSQSMDTLTKVGSTDGGKGGSTDGGKIENERKAGGKGSAKKELIGLKKANTGKGLAKDAKGFMKEDNGFAKQRPGDGGTNNLPAVMK